MVTFDLGRVTTFKDSDITLQRDCGDVRSRTSYNDTLGSIAKATLIVVTFDLGRVTTLTHGCYNNTPNIVVTFDLGRVTTERLKKSLR